MKKILTMGVVISTLALTGCYYYGPCLNGSGPVMGEVRSISDFTGIVNTGSFDVYITQSDEFYVEVIAQENLFPIIETYVSGYTLIIETKNGSCYRSSSPVEVHVSLPELEVLRLTGSGKVFADVAETQIFECSNAGSGIINIDSVIAKRFSLINSGSGSVDILESYVNEVSMTQSGSGTIEGGIVYESNDVSIRHTASGRVRSIIMDGTLVNAILSGSGKIDLAGEASVADFTLNSSGKIDALDLTTADIEATNTGSGKIFVYATELLKATITGSGDIIYRGDPTISFQITGSGSLRRY